MKELKLGFLVNTKHIRTNFIAQRIHLLIIRIILYYCYSGKNIQWGYLLFESGLLHLSTKKISLQTVAKKSANKLLSDLLTNVSERHFRGKCGGDLLSQIEEGDKESSKIVRSWEEVLTIVASDFNWDDETCNWIFILTSTDIAESSRIRSIASSLYKNNQVRFVIMDTNSTELSHGALNPATFSDVIFSKSSPLCTIPTDLLSHELAVLWFRQSFTGYLRGEVPSSEVQLVQYTGTSTTTTALRLSPLQTENHLRGLVSLSYKRRVVWEDVAGFLDHEHCYFVGFAEDSTETAVSLLESVEKVAGIQTANHYVLKHLSPSTGLLFVLPGDFTVPDNEGGVGDETQFDLLSFHDLVLAADGESLGEIFKRFSVQNNREEVDDTSLMEQLKEFHNLHLTDPSFTLSGQQDIENDSKDSITSEVSQALGALPHATFLSATQEAMSLPSPRCHHRENLTALIRRHQHPVEGELRSPGKLKVKYGADTGNLVKEHKLQVVLHMLWFSVFSERDVRQKEMAMSGILSLLRSLSFLTSPTEMFKFLNDQVLEEFYMDCGELLRELYEDGLLMEIPEILCEDSNSLSSSLLSLQLPAVQTLFCSEDTQSSQSNDMAPSQSTFTRHRSWMDPSQLSQNSFSISVPKSKKKKKKEKEVVKKVKDTADVIAAKVCSQIRAGLQESSRGRYLSNEVTPDEAKHSSKRRKLSRKNSVLDTPLKKQVKNPTTAKSSRARNRIEVTPQKCASSVSQIQESPVRGSLSRASSFFGSQTKPGPMRSFVMKDGFKTPTRPKTTPPSPTEDIPPLLRSPDPASQDSQHSFTPPGTPLSGRKFVKRLVYNSPMRALFGGGTVLCSRSKHLERTDYISTMGSPLYNRIEDKENEENVFPSLQYLDTERLPPNTDYYKYSKNTLEPIIHPGVNEDAQMPTFEASPYQGTINLQSKGGFLKLLEDSCSSLEKRRESDNDSDTSSISSFRGILKSPFANKGRRTKRSVSFSLDTEIPFSSDNESETTTNDFHSLLSLVDSSIKNDDENQSLLGCIPLDDDSGDSRKRKRKLC